MFKKCYLITILFTYLKLHLKLSMLYNWKIWFKEEMIKGSVIMAVGNMLQHKGACMSEMCNIHIHI